MARIDGESRERFILDAAAALFARHGYDKTTVSDIAQAAGISKGAIYLHFASKDALFEALLVREMQQYTHVWLARIDADPAGGTLAGMYRAMLYALQSSALMMALFKQEQRLFGTYLHKPDNLFATFADGEVSPRFQFVVAMQEAGAIRQDVDANVLVHIMNMLAYGLVSVGDIVPASTIPPLEDVIEGIAEMMARAFAPEDGGNRDAGKVIVRQIAEAAQQQFDEKQRK